MNARILASMALILSVASGLCYDASSPGFHLLPWNLANFAGMTFGAIAGIAWLAAASGRHRARPSILKVEQPAIGHPLDESLA